MKIRIGLVTFHSSANYGAMLQAYALQRHLILCGYECVIINYVTKAHVKEYLPNGETKRPRNNKERYERFMRFMKNHMILTKEKYYFMSELEKNFPIFDVYMTGSDQVWNLDFKGDVTPVYFLGMPGFKNKIAYGPSIGKCNPDEIKKMKNYLEDYRYIFPREYSTAKYLSNMLGKPIDSVVDPTLLLSRKEWLRFVKRNKQRSPYLLFYIAADDDYSFKKAQKVARALGGIDVITLSYQKTYSGYHVYNCVNAGPIGFLNLVYNADFVFTTSFHGSIFSILYNIPFYTICQYDNDTRLLDLFDVFSLESRLVMRTEKMCLSREALLKKPDVSDAQLEAFARDSREKLQNAIENVFHN